MSSLREVTLAEAFFRIDDSLSLYETNVPVVFVNTNFPQQRPRTYKQSNDGGINLPGKEGSYTPTKSILDTYEDR